MPTPGEHKTVQSRILEYAEAIGWTVVSREEAEQRRGFDPVAPPAERARNRSLFLDDLLDAKVREFNPLYEKKADGNVRPPFETHEAMKESSWRVFATESPLERQNKEFATNRLLYMSHIGFL